MKPRYHCSSCDAELQWGAATCSNCREPVEWPGEQQAKGHTKSRRQKGAEGTASQAVSWKLMGALAVFIVGGVVALELLTGNRSVPSGPQQPAQSAPASANMEAMNHLNELERQVAANPNDLQALLHLANFAHDNRFFDKAIAHYKQYIAKNPSNPDAIVDLGICYNELGDLDQARATMESALKVKPDHLLGHFNLGIVNLRAGDVEKSNEWFRKTVALAPNSEVGQRAQSLLNQHLNLPSN